MLSIDIIRENIANCVLGSERMYLELKRFPVVMNLPDDNDAQLLNGIFLRGYLPTSTSSLAGWRKILITNPHIPKNIFCLEPIDSNQDVIVDNRMKLFAQCDRLNAGQKWLTDLSFSWVCRTKTTHAPCNVDISPVSTLLNEYPDWGLLQNFICERLTNREVVVSYEVVDIFKVKTFW